MAITPKPNRKPTAAAPTAVDAAAAAFIEAAGQPVQAAAEAPAAPAKAKKDPVMVRFDDAALARIDREAARRGLSRAAWMRMVIADHLDALDEARK